MAGAWPPTEYLAFLSLRLVSKRGWDHSQHCVLGSHSAGGWGGGGAAPWRARSHAPRASQTPSPGSSGHPEPPCLREGKHYGPGGGRNFVRGHAGSCARPVKPWWASRRLTQPSTQCVPRLDAPRSARFSLQFNTRWKARGAGGGRSEWDHLQLGPGCCRGSASAWGCSPPELLARPAGLAPSPPWAHRWVCSGLCLQSASGA